MSVCGHHIRIRIGVVYVIGIYPNFCCKHLIMTFTFIQLLNTYMNPIWETSLADGATPTTGIGTKQVAITCTLYTIEL